MSLLLQTFGAPSLRSTEGEVRLNAKELALLVYLRVTGRPHTRGAIGQLLWGNIAIGRNNSVNTAISALRRVLPDGALPLGADPVALGTHLPCDVDAVLKATNVVAEPAELLNILRTHQAPFLDGFEFQLGEGADGFIAWMQERRASFDTTLAQALEDHLAAAATAGNWKTVQMIARAGYESVPAWPDYAEWMKRVNRTRTRSRRTVVGLSAVATLLVIFLLLRPALAGSAPACRAGEAHAQLVRQTYPAESNQAVRQDQRYTPAWYLKNVAPCAWGSGARVVRVSSFGPTSLNTEATTRSIPRPVPPNQVVKVDIRMQGPRLPGQYGEDWELLDQFGKHIKLDGGAKLYVRFQVLPPQVPACREGEVKADKSAESHPHTNIRMRPGERITVSWTFLNLGTCVWDTSVFLRFREASGPRLSDSAVSTVRITEGVNPTDAHTFHVPMRAPQSEGSYLEAWELVGPNGKVVRVSDAPGVYARIVVSRTDGVSPTEPECAVGEEVVGFIMSETVRDGSRVPPGSNVAKEWTLQNLGPCTWPAGALRLKQVGSRPELPNQPTPWIVVERPVPGNGTYTFRAPFTAPSAPGHYCFYWQMYNRAGDSIPISQTWKIWTEINVVQRRRIAAPAQAPKPCS